MARRAPRKRAARLHMDGAGRCASELPKGIAASILDRAKVVTMCWRPPGSFGKRVPRQSGPQQNAPAAGAAGAGVCRSRVKRGGAAQMPRAPGNGERNTRTFRARPWLPAAAARQALSGTAQLVRSCAPAVVTPLRPRRVGSPSAARGEPQRLLDQLRERRQSPAGFVWQTGGRRRRPSGKCRAAPRGDA